MSFSAPLTDTSVKAFMFWDPQLGAGFFFFLYFFSLWLGSPEGAIIRKDNQDDCFPVEVQFLCFYFLTGLLLAQQADRSLQLCVPRVMFKTFLSRVTSFARFSTDNCRTGGVILWLFLVSGSLAQAQVHFHFTGALGGSHRAVAVFTSWW